MVGIRSPMGYAGVLLDLNGVLYEDQGLLKGSIEAVQLLKDHGIPHLFLTNNTTQSSSQLAQQLQSLGLPIEADAILSPVQAAVQWLKNKRVQKIHLVVADDVKPEFKEFNSDHSQPDYIVLGDIGERWNYPILNHLFEMLVYGAEMLVLHKGRYWQKGGRLHLDIGAFVQGLEYSSDKEATIIGKPAKLFYEQALLLLGQQAEQVCMLGDDIESDVAGAQNAGIKGVLVKTGKYRPELLSASNIVPDGILDSIANLSDFLGY